jgi:cell division protein FtsA
VKLKVSISEALLALPPFGLEIFQTKQVTTIISDEGKIGNIDIRNIYSLIKNGALPLDNQLIDVAPERYILDEGRSFLRPPLHESSSTLTVLAKVHTLPKRIAGEYHAALSAGGVSLKRSVIAPFAACELLSTYEDVPADYLLVDIGSNMTTVSLIGAKELYASRYFEWGGDRITEKIIESFNINEDDAEKYKITYGIDRREMNFKAPICTTNDGYGNEIKHYTDELNTIIKSELDIFVKQLNEAIDSLLEGYDSSAKALPMILVGGGSKLNGLVEFIEPKVQSESVKVVSPRTLGARNPTFTNCLGMILADKKYPNVYDETHPRVGQLTREEDK